MDMTLQIHNVTLYIQKRKRRCNTDYILVMENVLFKVKKEEEKHNSQRPSIWQREKMR